MVISSSKGKLISNNISRTQAITESITTRVSSTAENTKRQLERSASNTATDHDTKKVLRNTERVAAPVVTAALHMHAKHQIKHFQNLADKYVRDHQIGDDMTSRLNEMGMSAKSFDTKPDEFGTRRSELNANMDERFTVNVETARNMNYQNGARISSTKHTVAVFKTDEFGGGAIEVKHLRGIGEMKHIHYEAYRTAVYNAVVLRRKMKTSGMTDELVEKYNKNVKNAKEHFRLSYYGKQQNKFARRFDTAPKKLSRQMLRLGTTQLEDSESMRGIHIGQSCYQVVQTASKMILHTSVNVLWNVTVTGVKAAVLAKNLYKGDSFGVAFRKARMPLEVFNKSNPGGPSLKFSYKTYGSLKGEIKALVNRGMNTILVEATKNTQMGEFFRRRADIMQRNAGVHKAAKTELKALHREWMNKGIKKVAPKTYAKTQKLSANVSKKLFDPAKLAMKKAKDAIWNRLKIKVLSKILVSIQQALSAIAAVLGPIFAVIGGILIGLFILMILSCFVDGNAAAQRQNRAFIISQADGKAIMNSLEAQHQEMLNEINAIAAKYDTADIQYPSGSKENYKELFCAMQVQLEYDLSLTNNKYSINGDPTLTDIAAELYDRTHIVSEEPYKFTYDDGTVGTACHINIDIQRNETLAYSMFEGKVPSDVFADANSAVAPSGICDATNWMDVCLTVKTLIAQTQAQYNQSGWIWIEVNGKKYHVRTDCSGYVSACLQVYGATTGVYGTGILISDQKFPGFTYMRWPGWDNLKQGDILVRRFTGTDSNGGSYDAGHTEIFYANSGNQHLVFSNGSTAGIQSIYPRHDNVAAYDIIYRPMAAGEIADSEETALDSAFGENKKYIFRDWSRSFGENAMLLASNMEDVVINPETGNEDGYDSAIKATVASGEFAPLSYTGTGAGTDKEDIHYVARGRKFTSASSLDYIRYICAQHGVCADYSFDNMVTNTYTTTDAPYSPVVDDSIKRSNPGAATGTESTESDSDLPILQRPYAFDKGMNDLGNLQVGDIMFYVWDLGSWTANYEDTDYNEWEIGTTKFYDALDHSIPMMYIGDGNFTYYAGMVKTMNVSEMEQNRCLNKKIIRYVGFTVSPVYGSTPSFCGWTDNKIGELIVLQQGSQWTEGKVHLAPYGFSEEQEQELREMADEDEINEWNELDANMDRGGMPISPYDSKDIDYSFYHEEIFEGDIYTPTDAHVSTLMNEICSISIKYYDMYGILPSTAYCHMGAVSHFRSTEESLLYYNLFELYDSNGPGVDKYTYTNEGDASSSIKNYKRYSSYLAAYQDFARYAKDHDYEIDSEFAETFKSQKDAYLAHSLINGETSDKMTSIYNKAPLIDGIPALQVYDEAAIERKNAIDNVVNATKEIKDSEFSATKPSSKDYYAYCKLLSNLAAYIEELDSILTEYHSATVRTNSVLDEAIKTWEDGDKIATAAYKYWKDHAEEEYIVSVNCGGHIMIDGSIQYTHKDNPKDCNNKSITTEEWEEHDEIKPWKKPSYINKYKE